MASLNSSGRYEAADRAVSQSQFVCVFNGKRDDYQVPIALHEAGLLDRLVTDFYMPRVRSRLLPAWLTSRNVEQLPVGKVSSHWQAFLLQTAATLLKLPMSPVYRSVDRMLGNAAGRLAQARGSGLYCYHTYLPESVPEGTKLIVFVYHPLPAMERQILAEDTRQFPGLAATARAVREPGDGNDMAIDWQRADAVVCASRFTARSVVADGCPAEKISVIPYGLPGARIVGSSSGERERPKNAEARFLFVGQGVQRKGLHHLIKAWEDWQENNPSPARLSIVSYRIDPQIRAMIRHPTIELLGYQSREELNRLYADADVFVLPSLVEGFGLVYLEALAHGCHVIGTDNTGLPELPLGDDERTLVKAGSIQSLAEALDRCATKAREGDFNRPAIREASARWTQADFRAAIGRHAKEVLGGRLSPA